MKKWSIQKKVIALILMLGIVLVSSLSVMSNVFYRRVVENQVMPLSKSTVHTLALNLQLHSYTYLSLITSLSGNPEVVELAAARYDDMEQKNQGMRILDNLLSATNYWERASWPAYMMLLCQDGTILTNQTFSHGSFMAQLRKSIVEDVYYKRLMSSSTTVTWMGVRDNTQRAQGSPQLYIAQNVVRHRKSIGILICAVDVGYYSSLMEHGRISELSDIYLVNKNGDIITGGAGGRTLDQLRSVEENADSRGYVTLEGTEYLCLRENVDFPDYGQRWELMLLHPVDGLTEELNSVQSVVFFIGAVLVAVLLVVAVYINRAVLRPIVYYRRKISEIGTDNFSVQIQPVGQNEVLDLGNGLKTMMDRIQAGMVKLKERETALRKLEIQTLTAQINPHFIRNTLNSVRVMAEMSGTPVLAEAIRTFTKLIDYIFHGNRESTVAGEIDYLQDYMGMQNLRWQHKFYFQVDVAPEMMDESIPALILQPIVENSITHGFWGRKGSGQILLTGYVQEGDMVFVVSDDGVGIENPNVLQTHSGAPHGLSNIHSRLRLLYGESYGLQIKKREQGGTEVTVRIPLGGSNDAENHDRG